MDDARERIPASINAWQWALGLLRPAAKLHLNTKVLFCKPLTTRKRADLWWRRALRNTGLVIGV
jgi:hypothetical protein